MLRDPTQLEHADRLDALWDEVIVGGEAFSKTHASNSIPDEMFAMVKRIQAMSPAIDDTSRARVRRTVFDGMGGVGNSLLAPPPEELRPISASRSSQRPRNLPRRIGSFVSVAAIVVLLLGAFLIFSEGRSFFGGGSNDTSDQALVPANQDDQPVATPTTGHEPSRLFSDDRRGVLWTLDPPGRDVEAKHAALIDGTVYRLTRSESFTGIEAIDSTSGEPVWNKQLAWNGFGFAGDANALYVPLVNGIVALDQLDGSEHWRTETDLETVSIAAADGVIYAWDGLDGLRAIDAVSSEELWAATTSEPAPSTSPDHVADPMIAGTSVIVTTALGDLIAFDQTTGQQEWLIGGFSSSNVELHVADDGTLVAVGLQGVADGSAGKPNFAMLLAIDPDSGETLWYKQITSVSPSVVVSDNTVMLLADIPFRSPDTATIVEADGARTEVIEGDRLNAPVRVYGLDLATGDMLVEWNAPRETFNATGRAWVSDQGSPPFSSLAPFDYRDALILAISDSGRLTSLSTDTGLFTGIIDLAQPLSQSPFGVDSVSFALLDSGQLVRLDPDVLKGVSGVTASPSNDPQSIVEWTLLQSNASGSFESLGGMTVANSMIYRTIETSEGRLVQAVYGSTGQLAWEVEVDWLDRGIAANGGGVFVADSANQLLLLDPYSGQTRITVPFGDNDIVGMTLDDDLYVWDESNTMTAVASGGEAGVVWQREASDASGNQTSEQNHPAPLVADDLVIMVDGAGTVHAFDRKTGDMTWSRSGFDATNTRFASQEGLLLVLSSPSEGELIAHGLDLETGEPLWNVILEGRLFEPVATNETFFYVIADEVTQISTQDTAFDPIEDYAGPGSWQWTGSKAALEEDSAGGRHVYGIDANTGEIVWSRSSLAGGFVQLQTGCPNSCGLTALTSDGQIVGLGRENGSISGEPSILPVNGGASVAAIVDGGLVSELGSFASLTDGTLVNYGVWHFNEQG